MYDLFNGIYFKYTVSRNTNWPADRPTAKNKAVSASSLYYLCGSEVSPSWEAVEFTNKRSIFITALFHRSAVFELVSTHV